MEGDSSGSAEVKREETKLEEPVKKQLTPKQKDERFMAIIIVVIILIGLLFVCYTVYISLGKDKKMEDCAKYLPDKKKAYDCCWGIGGSSNMSPCYFKYILNITENDTNQNITNNAKP